MFEPQFAHLHLNAFECARAVDGHATVAHHAAAQGDFPIAVNIRGKLVGKQSPDSDRSISGNQNARQILLPDLRHRQRTVTAQSDVLDILRRQANVQRRGNRHAFVVIDDALQPHTQSRAHAFQLERFQHALVAAGDGRWRLSGLDGNIDVADNEDILETGDEQFALDSLACVSRCLRRRRAGDQQSRYDGNRASPYSVQPSHFGVLFI